MSEKTLALFRGKGRCAACGFFAWARHAHHLLGRGVGGGLRLDHPWNLCSLCPGCHQRHHHGGRPRRSELVRLVSRREQLSEVELLAELHRLRRLTKEGEEFHDG